jgi:hypothetical protein
MAFEKMTVKQHPGPGRKPLKLPPLGSFKKERKDRFKKLINWLSIGTGWDKKVFIVESLGGKHENGVLPIHWVNVVDACWWDTYFVALGVELTSDATKQPKVLLKFLNASTQLERLSEKYQILCLIKVKKRR